MPHRQEFGGFVFPSEGAGHFNRAPLNLSLEPALKWRKNRRSRQKGLGPWHARHARFVAKVRGNAGSPQNAGPKRAKGRLGSEGLRLKTEAVAFVLAVGCCCPPLLFQALAMPLPPHPRLLQQRRECQARHRVKARAGCPPCHVQKGFWKCHPAMGHRPTNTGCRARFCLFARRSLLTASSWRLSQCPLTFRPSNSLPTHSLYCFHRRLRVVRGLLPDYPVCFAPPLLHLLLKHDRHMPPSSSSTRRASSSSSSLALPLLYVTMAATLLCLFPSPCAAWSSSFLPSRQVGLHVLVSHPPPLFASWKERKERKCANASSGW